MAGTADVPGALGSSIRSLMLGGTTRPGVCGGFAGVGGAAAIGFATGAGSTTGGGAGASSMTGTGAGSGVLTSAAAGAGTATAADGTSATGATGSTGGSTAGGGGASCTGSSTCVATAGAAGLAVLTSLGGASVGAAGFGGSAFFAVNAGFLAPGFSTGPSANMSPPGSVMLRSRARRSTNCRATTSSIVLDALFSSMPCARFSSASTSWLLVLRSSATL
jgi:hypothetical protein